MSWADVNANIVVKPVTSPIASDPWEINETSLILMEGDRGAQRSFFRTTEFDSFGEKQCGPPRIESDWYDLMSRILDATQADEKKGMGKIVGKAKHRRPTAWEKGHRPEDERVSKGGRKRGSGWYDAGTVG